MDKESSSKKFQMDFLASEISELEKLLTLIHDDNVIERLSLEARLEKVKVDLVELMNSWEKNPCIPKQDRL